MNKKNSSVQGSHRIIPVIPAGSGSWGREELRQADCHKFEASLGYIMNSRSG